MKISKTRSGRIFTQWNKNMYRMTNIFHKHHIWKTSYFRPVLLSWNEKICFQRLTFSTNVTSEHLLLSWNWKMCLQEANIFNKCCIWRTCYYYKYWSTFSQSVIFICPAQSLYWALVIFWCEITQGVIRKFDHTLCYFSPKYNQYPI